MHDHQRHPLEIIQIATCAVPETEKNYFERSMFALHNNGRVSIYIDGKGWYAIPDVPENLFSWAWLRMCCGNEYRRCDSAINGECPDCGAPTVDGEAQDICRFSPLVCETCGYRPCDESC